MPRKSAAELAVAPNVVEVTPRPVAPTTLTDEEASEWDAIVSALPADWFPRDTHAMLEQHCKHIIQARRISQLIEACQSDPELDLRQMKELLDMQEKQSRLIMAGATKMRLSQQTKHDREKGKGGRKAAKPWEK